MYGWVIETKSKIMKIYDCSDVICLMVSNAIEEQGMQGKICESHYITIATGITTKEAELNKMWICL